MIELKGDIWSVDTKWVCIPTNGCLDKRGNAVMGAGLAAQAAKMNPRMKRPLGNLISNFGNNVYLFYTDHKLGKKIVSFPTKDHWKDNSSLELIEKSAKQLFVLQRERAPRTKVAIPRVGCGLGGLKWEDVKPVLEKELPGNSFIAVDFSSEVEK